jgi:hypothetical protein
MSDVKRYVWTSKDMVETDDAAFVAAQGIDLWVDSDDYANAIAERDTLRAEVDRLQSKYHEAVALLRRWAKYPVEHWGAHGPTDKFLATIDAEEAKSEEGTG